MKELLTNIDKVHSTKLGLARIKKNLQLDCFDVIEYCKNIIINKKCVIKRIGKNYYCEMNDIIITINAYNYTIITAHLIRR